jgi:hypothetical protein
MSPEIARSAAGLPVAVLSTTRRAGLRQPMNSRWFASSSAMGKFAWKVSIGQVGNGAFYPVNDDD